MDYEKKYNDALERAKQFMSEHPTRAEADLMVALFPELAESEDERIRTRLLEYFHGFKDSAECPVFWEGLNIDNILTWLEKQKINTEGDFGRGYDCGYEACLNSHGAEWFEKQKEQKPIEIKIDNPNIEKVDPDMKITTSDSSADGDEIDEKLI